MVKLDKIYTRGGDSGKTSLCNGQRVAKHDQNVEALGAIDEANAAIGLARLHAKGEEGEMLARIQNDLFDLGADLAVPIKSKANARRITEKQVKRLELEIDAMNKDLPPLDSFILPGGSAASAFLHMARAVTRRAERQICKLAEEGVVNKAALCFANRLSDHLFTLSRCLNKDEGELWRPGENG